MLRLSFAFAFIASLCSSATYVCGEDIEITEVPHQVSIQFDGKHVCSGSLIETNWVVTAANCFYELATNNITVRVGSEFLDKNGQLIVVEKIMIHSEFSSTLLTHNIALVRLTEDVTLSETVEIIPLASQEVDVGTQAYTSGWGGTSPTHLNGVAVSLTSLTKCHHVYPKYGKFANVCASVEGKDHCKGDKGGPLEADDKLIGIVSWGEGCDEKPLVSTSVPQYFDWINENIA